MRHSYYYLPHISFDMDYLSEEESQHCIRVLRMKKGDIVQLTDGKGNLYQAVILDANPKNCAVQILEKIAESSPKNYYIHIALAPTKNIERTEWFLEKSVEAGIDEVSFLLCEHSERRNINMDRMNKIAVSAMKQSLKSSLPKINDLIKLDDFIKKASLPKQKFIAYLTSEKPHLLKNEIKKNKEYCILIGPEGDFSKAELESALKNGMKAVSLGKSRLRTETAALLACFTCNLINEE